jgi:CRISPR-associated protein Cmr4
MTITQADAGTETAFAPALYTQQRFLFMTLDPVHIGTGGYRLGRVDMTIAREPGTNLPKIPGTSLAGATRNYAAMRYGKPDVAGQQNIFKKKKVNGTSIQLCPIIYTFGTATSTGSDQAQPGGDNQAGTVSIGDAQILFFPVNSMVGPVWVSTVETIEEVWDTSSLKLPQKPTDDVVVTSLGWNRDLNLGWLMFNAVKGLDITPPSALDQQLGTEWSAIKGRIVLVSPKIFSQIVNSNLEVRTSVSINPETGAAEQGALFTYEAIPRAAWLWCDVVEDDYRLYDNGTSKFPVTNKQCKIEVIHEQKDGKTEEKKMYTDNAGADLDKPWKQPLDVVRAGMNLIRYLGVGGMGTRGFGRMACVADWKVSGGGE